MEKPPLDSFIVSKPSLDTFTAQNPLDGFANISQPTRTTTGGVVSPTFTATPGENPLIAGAKAVGNIPSSAFGLGKSLFEAVKSPAETVKAVGGVLGGAGSKILESTVGKGVEALTGQPIQKADTQAFDTFTQVLKQRYGSLDALQKTATEDPIGFGADLLSVIEGGAGLAGKTAGLNRAISRTGQLVTEPVTRAGQAVGTGISRTAQFGLSQATGLNPETITNIVKNPQALKNINPELRIETAQKVADALDTRLTELSEVGKGYDAIRQNPVPITIPKNTISNVLNKYGVRLDENNQIITSPQSRPLSPVDRGALQDFINNYGAFNELDSNSFLNTREALSNLSKFEQGKTSLPQQIARDLRSSYDAIGKKDIPGLANLDAQYAPEKQLLSKLKKDIFTPQGELKDGAISKIANITGKGKEQLLERVKQIIPDIEQRANLIKTVEDIERASGLKVGTYTRAGIGLTAVTTGNIPVLIGAILAQPEIAVPLLKGAGYVGQKARPILDAVRNIANDVNNFTIPKPVVEYAKNPKFGLSIEDVTKTTGKVDNTLLQEAKKYKSAEEFVDKLDEIKNPSKNFEILPNSYLKAPKKIYRGENGLAGLESGTGSGAEGFGLYTTTDKKVAEGYAKLSNSGIVKEMSIKDIPKNPIYFRGPAEARDWATRIARQQFGMRLPEFNEKIGINKLVNMLGHDGVAFDLGNGVAYAKYPETGITKSQLTDIWNKANKK